MSGIESVVTQVSRDDDGDVLLTQNRPTGRKKKASGQKIGHGRSSINDSPVLVDNQDESDSEEKPHRCIFCFCCWCSRRHKPRRDGYQRELEITTTFNSTTPRNSSSSKSTKETTETELKEEIISLPPQKPLLPMIDKSKPYRKCLVLDLDETLVHSSFKPVPDADFVVPVEIENIVHQVYVLKRPHVDEFMKRVGKLFEVVVFTASLAKYADPVLDLLDKHKVIEHRLFRDACSPHRGNYVKDLSRLGRDLRHCIIIDNSPHSYIFQPENALPVSTWFDEKNDRELLDMLPTLEALAKCDDVIALLRKIRNKSGAVVNPEADG